MSRKSLIALAAVASMFVGVESAQAQYGWYGPPAYGYGYGPTPYRWAPPPLAPRYRYGVYYGPYSGYGGPATNRGANLGGAIGGGPGANLGAAIGNIVDH